MAGRKPPPRFDPQGWEGVLLGAPHALVDKLSARGAVVPPSPGLGQGALGNPPRERVPLGTLPLPVGALLEHAPGERVSVSADCVLDATPPPRRGRIGAIAVMEQPRIVQRGPLGGRVEVPPGHAGAASAR